MGYYILFRRQCHFTSVFKNNYIDRIIILYSCVGNRFLFQQIFPALSEKGGLEDIKETIRDVITRQKSCPEIVIEVHETFVTEIKELVSGKIPANCLVSVKAGVNLEPGDCNLSWENGGATRNPGAIAETIEKELAGALAERPRLSDNRETIPPIGEKP